MALHRLAWLLHHENSDLRSEEVLVLVFHNALREYISHVLPALGIEGVTTVTYAEWVAKATLRALRERYTDISQLTRPDTTAPSGVLRVKASLALLKAVEKYVADQTQRVLQHLKDAIPWSEFPTEFQQSSRAILNRTPLYIVTALSELQHLLTLLPASTARANAKQVLQHSLRKATLYHKDLTQVLNDPATICAHDETSLLDHQLIAQAAEYTAQTLDAGHYDAGDDAIILRLYQLKHGATPLHTGGSGHYRHIVLDETQDFGTMQLASVIGSVEQTRQLTLVGDVNQRIDREQTFPGWEVLRKHWDLRDEMSHFVSLEISHRCTAEIMRLAEHVLGTKRALQGRSGKRPLWFECKTEEEAVSQSIDWLKKAVERFPHTLTAVICRTASEARYVLSLLTPTFGPAVRLGDEESFSFDAGIVVTDVSQVKGLEFYAALLWNPTAAHYSKAEHHRNLLYVACSRAEEYLCLVTHERPSSLLPHIYSKLVRGVRIGFEEE